MDFDPTEIRRMMEKRQRELRGRHAEPDDTLSPSKRIRHEKENEVMTTSSPEKQGFMAKFAVSPKNTRRGESAALSRASPSTKSRLNDLSKRYAEFEDELPKRSCSVTTATTTKKKAAPQPSTTHMSQKKRAPSPPVKAGQTTDTAEVRKKWEITEGTTVTIRRDEPSQLPKATVSTSIKEIDPSEANVAQKAKQFDKPDQTTQEPKRVAQPKSKVLPRGNIAEKISRFNVEGSGPRCEVDSKPMGSVSSRAKFFEKAMEADKKAADAVYVPVSQRVGKFIDKEEQTLSEKYLVRPMKPVVCTTVVSSLKTTDVVRESTPEEGSMEESFQHEDDVVEEACQPDDEDSLPVIHEERHNLLDTEKEPSPQHAEIEEPKPSTSEPRKVGTISSKLKNRLENLLVNGHHSPDDTLISISERPEEQPRKLLEQLEEEEEDLSGIRPHYDPTMSPKPPKTPEKCVEDVQRIVYQIPSNMMQEIRKGKDNVNNDVESNEVIESYRRQMEEEMTKQESIMKQTSHALLVCQENGDRGSEQQVEAERLLLIATQRHHVAQSELQRLSVKRSVSKTGGTLTICDIKLPYKNEFLKLMRQCNDVLESTHYFIVLVRSEPSLLHTELVSTNDKILGGSVSLNHHMVLKNIQDGFRVFVEVFAVQALNRNHPEYEATIKKIRREKEKESHKGGGILSAFTPSKKKNPGTPHAEELKIRKPSFGLIGRVTLDESLIALDKQVHYLDNYFNESPLDGRIFMKTQLNMPPKVTHCGMLRLKGSNGYISSYFAAIEGSHLNMWDDVRAAEEEQEPIRTFELSKAADTVRVEKSFSFYYFPLKFTNGVELQFLTYSEEESNLWADKLNACVARYSI